MEDSRLVGTPTSHKMSKSDDSTKVNQTLCRSMVGKLQYVVHRRPGIALVVGIIFIFSTNPREKKVMIVKRILRYLKGI